MSRPFVELVAAVGPRWELGHQGGMPWGKIKGDLSLFRRLTEGKAVIMINLFILFAAIWAAILLIRIAMELP